MGIGNGNLLSILSFLLLTFHPSIITASSEQTHRELQGTDFPDECTWQCYLRQNPDLSFLLPWDEEQAIRHYLQSGKQDNRPCACKVIILAGPHKSSSTSLQSLGVFYSMIPHVTWKWLGRDAKDFAPFFSSWKRQPDLGHAWRDHSWHLFKDEMIAMYKKLNDNMVDKHEPSEDEVKTEMLHFATLKEIYKHKLSIIYDSGYNVIFGNEEIDTSTMDGKSPLIDELVDMLPSKTVKYRNKHLTILVVYRAPRAEHLKSMYGEVHLKGNYPEPKSYSSFLCESKNLKGLFHTIDSLALALEFLKRGIKLQLFDMMSMSDDYHKKIELFSILGCDVMGLKCLYDEEVDQTIPYVVQSHFHKDKWIKELRKPKNVRDYSKFEDDVVNISDLQTLQIEEVLKTYDCGQYIEVMKYQENLEILHGHQFHVNMDKCDGTEKMTIDEVVESIYGIMDCESKGYEFTLE